jgi:DNA-binding CsgD family transcriptional regulator
VGAVEAPARPYAWAAPQGTSPLVTGSFLRRLSLFLERERAVISETDETFTSELLFWGSQSRPTLTVDVIDDRTVKVSGLPVRDLVDRLQRDHESEVLVISNDLETRDVVDCGTLSGREAAIVRLITLGMSNHEIATTLFLSINTVKTYIRSAYRKMDVDSRSQAVLWGVRHGLHHRGPQQ